MKKIMFTMALVYFTFLGFAQKKDTAALVNLKKKNLIKLNMLALPARNIGIQYERLLGPRTSVAAQIRIMPKGPIPFMNYYEKWVVGDTAAWQSARVSSFTFTPEFRIYKGEVLRGFYFGPYFRFRTLKFNYDYLYEANNSSFYSNIPVEGKLTTYATGFLLGQHFTMGSRLSMDIYAFGLQVSYTKGYAIGRSANKLSSYYQQDLKNQLESFSDLSPMLTQQIEVDANGFNSTVSTVFAGFRGMGLCIGVRL